MLLEASAPRFSPSRAPYSPACMTSFKVGWGVMATLTAAATAAAPEMAMSLSWVGRQAMTASSMALSTSPGWSSPQGKIFIEAPLVARLVCTTTVPGISLGGLPSSASMLALVVAPANLL